MKVFNNKYLLIFCLLADCALSQEDLSKQSVITGNKTGREYSSSEIRGFSNAIDKRSAMVSSILNLQLKNHFRNNKSISKQDFFSSAGSNINFGGMYERYVFMNFTPQLSIRPADFIDIYANYNLLKVIPLEEINSQAYSFLIQSMAIIGTETVFKLTLDPDSWITDVISFASKNIILNLVIKPLIKDKNRKMLPWIQDESFYYSVSIKF